MTNCVRTHLVNILKLFCDCKDCLNVVVTQFLNQVSDGGIILQNRKRQLIPEKYSTSRSLFKRTSRYLHSNGSLCTHYSPSDIFHRWAAQCHPVCHHQQNGSPHQWRIPADGSHSSNQSGPEK